MPPTNAALFNGLYELDCGGATISYDSNLAGIFFKTASRVYMHDCNIVTTQTSSIVNGTAIAVAEAANESTHNANVFIDNVSVQGGAEGIAIQPGVAPVNNVHVRNFRWGQPTIAGFTGNAIYVTGNGGTPAGNIRIEDVDITQSIYPTTAFISGGVQLNGCSNCTVDRVRCTALDMSQSTNGACVAVNFGLNSLTNSNQNINISNITCDSLIWADCIQVTGFSSGININNVLARNMNNAVGITGLNTFQQGDCLDIFMSSKINISNVLCQNSNNLTHTLPSVEIFDTLEVSLSNVQVLDSGSGLKLFGAPSTHFTNVTTNRNFNAGYFIQDYNALVTCNGTTAVVFVSGPGGFGPWAPGTQITINGVPHQIASVTDGTHLTTAANCAVGASVTMLMPTTDVSIVNPKADDNGMNATGTGSRTGSSEGIFIQGGSQVTIIGGSANDNKATASKTQQYGLRVTGTARARVIGFDGSGNVGAVTAPCTGIEYGANVAGNHAICDDVKNSAVLLDDNTGPKWTLAASQTTDASLNITAGTAPTSPVTGDMWFDGTNFQVRQSTTTFNIEKVVASGTATFTTTAVNAAACQATVTVAATNTAATDIIVWTFNSQPTAATDASLIVSSWPTAGNVNFKRCNPTGASITPTALVANWQVLRR